MANILANYESNATDQDAIGDNGGDEYSPVAQSFQIATTGLVGSVELYVRKVNTISDPITVRIETHSTNQPSGTLADANATTTITPSNTSFGWVKATFPASFSLTGTTTYWIVCSVPAQSTNNRYDWQREYNASGSGYAGGKQALKFNGGAYDLANTNNIDYYFRVYDPEIVSGGFYYMSQ